jgi:TPP-dependent pyruvate/acetoin dehydrogenase alpha subunit
MRPQEEVERFRAGDPLPLLRSRLPEEAAQRIEREAARRVQDAVSWARSQPFPELPSHNAIAAPADGARA